MGQEGIISWIGTSFEGGLLESMPRAGAWIKKHVIMIKVYDEICAMAG